jgi:hypothetical protein
MGGITYRFVHGVRAQTDVQYRLASTFERWAPLHIRQSQLDGACGLHALAMALLVLTGMPRSRIEGMARTPRGPLRALWKLAQDDFFTGVEPEDLVRFLEPFTPTLTAEVITTSSTKRIGRAVETAVESGAVPLLSMDSRTWSHYCAIVGLERLHKRTAPSALLTIDSAHSAPWLTPFNGRLDLSGSGGRSVRVSKSYPLTYRYVGGEAWAVRLSGLVIVRRTGKPP